VTDDYWGRLIYSDAKPYEVEVENLLRAVSDIPYVFFDLGANYRYWSVRVVDDEFGAHKAFAVEASPSNAKILKMNQAENKYRFEVICNAVSNSNEKEVMISGVNHAGKSLLNSSGKGSEKVKTITIDRLLEDALALSGPVIIKLDIEGSELASIQGASKTLEKDSLVIYEDHGKDITHEVTKRLLAIGSVFYFDGSKLNSITRVNELNYIKKNPVHGYNFIFTKSEYWLNTLRARFACMNSFG
jgi:FkbM family methyltransferase